MSLWLIVRNTDFRVGGNGQVLDASHAHIECKSCISRTNCSILLVRLTVH